MNTVYIKLLALFLFAFPCYAATYFVNAINGNDKNNGLAESTPWKSISRVNKQNFLPGDQLLFHKGDTWENVSIKIKTSNFRISAYGTGQKPRLLGSAKVISWSKVPKINGLFSTSISPPYGQSNWEVQLLMEDGYNFYCRQNESTPLTEIKPGCFSYNKKQKKLYINLINKNISGKNFYAGSSENIIELQSVQINNLIVEDLEISLANRYGIGPWWQGDKKEQGIIAISNNTFIGNAFSAICLSGGMNFEKIFITNNTIRMNGAEGIYIGPNISRNKLNIINNQIGTNIFEGFGWRGEGSNSAFNGDGIDVKKGNINTTIEGNIIKNLNPSGCGICYHSSGAIIKNNKIENIVLDNATWPSGIMADIDDNNGISIISNNIISGSNMYGINVRGKADIAPPLIIETNQINLSPENPFSQIGFTAMNTANVTIKKNIGTGGAQGVKLTGSRPNNLTITDNHFGHTKSAFYFSSSELSGLFTNLNYICNDKESYIEWINGQKEKDQSSITRYLKNNNSIIEEECSSRTNITPF